MDDYFCVDDRFTLVAGGQTGADRAALDWAIEEGVRHGGWCPRGRRSEDGPLPDFYRLRETPDSGYLQRTEWNVRDSDATLVFTLSDKLDGGSQRTADFAERLCKPWLHVRPGVHPKFIARFLFKHQVMVLNVAGKRESSAPGISSLVRQVLAQALWVQREGTAQSQANL
ncbi:MAG: putative molybdenum carrier protein [Pseudomonadota bacterium]